MVENEVDIQSIEEELREANEYAKTVKEPEEQKEQKKRVEEFQEIIDSERELLHLFSTDRLKLEVVYGKKLLKFKIKPLENTGDIENIGLDFRTYMELDDLEKEIILKKNRGETLTSSEQEVYNVKEKEFAEGAMGNALDQAHHILATFLTPPSYKLPRNLLKIPLEYLPFIFTKGEQAILKKERNKKLTPEEQTSYNELKKEYYKKKPEKELTLKLMFWKRFPFDLKMFLFTEVVQRLGINPETELKLFQAD